MPEMDLTSKYSIEDLIEIPLAEARLNQSLLWIPAHSSARQGWLTEQGSQVSIKCTSKCSTKYVHDTDC